ncbi:hypothetical protein CC80DRAFT_550517 [Byssothecium circinans]|uniref:Uncharacterized protein n=1 Tax=Byssothecium circinans TaxID=147558 RepID=A0A6A5TP99_9PLEO|nr:hypothetical protein CC80DRAFT_550517 [Byssothecium circinans]
MKASTAFFLLLGSLNYLVDAKCYLPDGTAATNPQWAACSEDASDPLSTICCAMNRTNPAGGNSKDGPTAETCLPNGLCQNDAADDNGNHKFSYQRAYCTTADWNSGKCLTTCGATGSGFKQMTPCDGTSRSELWCCGNNKDCCNAGSKLEIVTLAAKFGQAPLSLSSSASAAPSATTSGGAANTPAASGASSSSSASSSASGAAVGASQTASSQSAGLTTGAKAGIGIGAVVGCAALIGIGALLALRKKNAKPNHAETAELNGYASHLTSSDSKRPYIVSQGGLHEAVSEREAGELYEQRQPHNMPPVELPGETTLSELGADSAAKPGKEKHF